MDRRNFLKLAASVLPIGFLITRPKPKTPQLFINNQAKELAKEFEKYEWEEYSTTIAVPKEKKSGEFFFEQKLPVTKEIKQEVMDGLNKHIEHQTIFGTQTDITRNCKAVSCTSGDFSK